MTPSAYRRDTEAIEASNRELNARCQLARSPRELIEALAALDESPAHVPHHGQRLADKEGC